MSPIPAVIQSMRPPFLVLAPICALLGAATVSDGTSISVLAVCLCVLGAVLAHISVNQLNEYLDFKSGLDQMTRKTPFSGGSGALPASPQAAGAVLASGVISLLATIGIGVYFAFASGWLILPIGVLGVLIIVFYTRQLNRLPWLCLIAPGMGFGLLMVAGSQYAIEGQFSTAMGWAAAVPFFLTNNLLLLNQYPDIDADAQAGRRHLLIAYGVPAGNAAYLLSALLAGLTVMLGVWAGAFPVVALVALLPLPLAFVAWRGAVQYGKAIGEHPQFMAMNVVLSLSMPALLAAALFFSRA